MMYRTILLLPILALIGLGCASTEKESKESTTESTLFGDAFDPSVKGMYNVSEMMTNTALHNVPVNLQGTIHDVCQKKGCWMVLSDGENQMRITFKDYGFFVPIDCSGKSVTVQGVVSVEEIPEDLAKHYAEESKGEDPDAIEGPQRVVTMVATGVQF